MANVKPDKKVRSRASRDRVAAASLAALGCPPRGETVPDASRVAGVGKVRLGEICEIEFGTRIRSKDSKSNDYPVYGGGGKTFGWETYNRENQCVVSRFAMSPECVRRVSGKFFLNDSGLTVSVKEGTALQGYIDCFLLGSQDKIYSLGRGCAQKNLRVDGFRELEIPLPPIPAQQRIADELDRLCALKKNAEDRLAILDQIVKSRFVEMFGDPVVNEKNWNTVGLLDIGECKNGLNFRPNDKGYDLHCIGVGDFRDNIEMSDTSIVPTISVNTRPSDELILRDGDILFVRSNGNKALVGRSLLVSPGSVETTFSGFCIRYRINSEKFLPKFAIHFLRHDSVRRALQGRGANIQNLNQKMIQSVSAILPPLALQREFASFVVEIDKSKAALRETVATLDQLYRAKLQEYFG